MVCRQRTAIENANQLMAGNRILLMGLMLWGLAMIVPDLVRVAQPLGSLGFYANNDGLIFDTNGPFPGDAASPAWRAGIRAGDKLDLQRMRCAFNDLESCSNTLAALGVQYVLPGRSVTIELAASADRPARQVTLIAEPRPSNVLIRAVVVLDQIAGILVIVAAAWLVWTQPSAMSWGFFLYVNWFNPGQVFAFYALLQPWPALLLAQDAAGCVAQAAGYAGLILFVLRVPRNKTEARWRPLERALPLVAVIFALALIASYGSVFGYPTETTTRAAILAGFAIAVCALGILMVRRRTQTPEDYQRVRWVIWGCLIGLPTFLVAELASETTLLEAWWDLRLSEDLIGLLYLVNGILCLFVFEAVRRPRVVSVAIPLRRVTILGLTLSAPVLLLHHEVERLQGHLALPSWAWLALGAVAVFLISRLHESAVHLADRYFNRALDQAERELGQALLKATKPAEIDRLLAEEPFRALRLTSAASFRRQGSVFVRNEAGEGWGKRATRTLRPDAPLLAPLCTGAPFSLAETEEDGLGLPTGLSRPILAVPAVTPIRCFAISLYGSHASGTDLDTNERAMLARLGRNAAALYAELESDELRGKIVKLERKLSAVMLSSRNGPRSG
jgi:hypothetical protein